MKLCVTFPHTSLHVRTQCIQAVSSFLEFEGWTVFNESYVGYSNPSDFYEYIKHTYRKLINHPDTIDVVIIGEGEGGKFAHLLSCLHSENCVLINPELDVYDDEWMDSNMKSTNRVAGECLTVLCEDSVEFERDQAVLDVSSQLKLLGNEFNPILVAHTVQEFVESNTINNLPQVEREER